MRPYVVRRSSMKMKNTKHLDLNISQTSTRGNWFLEPREKIGNRFQLSTEFHLQYLQLMSSAQPSVRVRVRAAEFRVSVAVAVPKPKA